MTPVDSDIFVHSNFSERLSAYQNATALFGKDVSSGSGGSNSNTLQSQSSEDGRRKKPVPLPRSKIPLAAADNQPASEEPAKPSQQRKPSEGKISLHARFFSKRAKTDLGFDGLAAYKANKRPPGGTKYPAPKVPTFNRPVPQQRQLSIAAATPSSRQAMPVEQPPLPRTTTFQQQAARQQKRGVSKENASAPTSSKIRPEVKEKPLFSTFKQPERDTAAKSSSASTKNNKGRALFRRQENRLEREQQRLTALSRVASESDLTKTIAIEDPPPPHRPDELEEAIEPVSITVNANYAKQQQLLEEESTTHSVSSDGNNRLVIDTSRDDGNELDNGSGDSSVIQKSEPLLITTQPLNDKSEPAVILSASNAEVDAMSETPDKSCSTSFESTTDDSMLLDGPSSSDNALDTSASAASGQLDLSVSSSAMNASIHSMRTKSPSSTSTTSRCPPSPVSLGLHPVRTAVVPEWDEYEDTHTGRKFYVNANTKEKSWKPPRKPRGSLDG